MVHNLFSETKPEFELFPNPAKDQLNIRLLNEESATLALEIKDVSGKVIKQVNAGFNFAEIYNLDISELSSGIYFIELSGEQSSSVRKFIKQQ